MQSRACVYKGVGHNGTVRANVNLEVVVAWSFGLSQRSELCHPDINYFHMQYDFTAATLLRYYDPSHKVLA